MPRFGAAWVDSHEGGGEFEYGRGEKYLWVRIIQLHYELQRLCRI